MDKYLQIKRFNADANYKFALWKRFKVLGHNPSGLRYQRIKDRTHLSLFEKWRPYQEYHLYLVCYMHWFCFNPRFGSFPSSWRCWSWICWGARDLQWQWCLQTLFCEPEKREEVWRSDRVSMDKVQERPGLVKAKEECTMVRIMARRRNYLHPVHKYTRTEKRLVDIELRLY